MPVSDVSGEVRARLFSFCDVRQVRGGKWSAALSPEAVQAFAASPWPPGQIVEVGADGFVVSNELDGLAGADALRAMRAGRYRELWAARASFSTFEAARDTIEEWVIEHRPDLVRACVDETNRAIAYRVQRAASR